MRLLNHGERPGLLSDRLPFLLRRFGDTVEKVHVPGCQCPGKLKISRRLVYLSATQTRGPPGQLD